MALIPQDACSKLQEASLQKSDGNEAKELSGRQMIRLHRRLYVVSVCSGSGPNPANLRLNLSGQKSVSFQKRDSK